MDLSRNEEVSLKQRRELCREGEHHTSHGIRESKGVYGREGTSGVGKRRDVTEEVRLQDSSSRNLTTGVTNPSELGKKPTFSFSSLRFILSRIAGWGPKERLVLRSIEDLEEQSNLAGSWGGINTKEGENRRMPFHKNLVKSWRTN